MKPQHFRTRLTVFAESHDYSPLALSFSYYFSRPSTMTKSSKTPSDDVLIPWLFLDARIATAHAHPPLDRILKAILSTCQVWIIILARSRMWYACCSRLVRYSDITLDGIVAFFTSFVRQQACQERSHNPISRSFKLLLSNHSMLLSIFFQSDGVIFPFVKTIFNLKQYSALNKIVQQHKLDADQQLLPK